MVLPGQAGTRNWQRFDFGKAWQCAALTRHGVSGEIKESATGGSLKDSANWSTDDATGYLTDGSIELEEGSSTENDETASGAGR